MDLSLWPAGGERSRKEDAFGDALKAGEAALLVGPHEAVKPLGRIEDGRRAVALVHVLVGPHAAVKPLVRPFVRRTVPQERGRFRGRPQGGRGGAAGRAPRGR
eukprot:1182083-Prorocentrum_minimum.AAC.1